MEPARVVVVTGVSGSGKSTVGKLLADRLGWAFQEGDDLHPPANVDRMSAGVPLTDEDRWPWLDRVATWIEQRLRRGESGVVTCSALKRSYRARLAVSPGVVFVHLAVDPASLRRRLETRRDHFMPPELLTSQLETLEEPGADERVVRVDADAPADEVVDRVLQRL